MYATRGELTKRLRTAADEVHAFASRPAPRADAREAVERIVKSMRYMADLGIPVKPECVSRWAVTLASQPGGGA
jgi:hypothetical protein